MSYQITTTEHTTMIRMAGRISESKTYIQNFSEGLTNKALKEAAWNENWFGFMGDSIFSCMMTGLFRRFGEYPKLTKILQQWIDAGIEHYDFRLICHLHIQLSDPYYRWLTGEYLPDREQSNLGEFNADLIHVDFAKQSTKELKANTSQRLLKNLIRSADECGLLSGTVNKKIECPIVSTKFFAYIIYVLQEFSFPMSELPESPYIKSVCHDEEKLKRLLIEGQRLGWWEFNWDMNMFTLSPKYMGIESWYEAAA